MTEAKEWRKGMGGIAEELGEIARKVRGALSQVTPFREFLSPHDIQFFPQLPGTIKTQQQCDKAIRKLKKNVEEHEQTLSNYRRDPDAYDNKGYLANAPNDERRNRIIRRRIKHLETEIAGYKQQIIDLEEGRY